MNADRAAREAAVIDAAAYYANRSDEQDVLRARVAALDIERVRALTLIVENRETNARAAELGGPQQRRSRGRGRRQREQAAHRGPSSRLV